MASEPDWTAIQQQGGALAIALTEPDPDRWLSYRLEIEKHLRLLKLDLSFWQRSRDPVRQQACQLSLQQRRQTLIRYCEAVLNAIADDPTALGN